MSCERFNEAEALKPRIQIDSSDPWTLPTPRFNEAEALKPRIRLIEAILEFLLS